MTLFKRFFYLFLKTFVVFFTILGLSIGLIIVSLPLVKVFFPNKPYKVETILSPDNNSLAILEYHTGNATVSDSIVMYLEGKYAPKQKKEILAMDKYDSFSVKWKSNKILLVEYSQANIYFFSNFWQNNSKSTKKTIEILLNLNKKVID